LRFKINENASICANPGPVGPGVLRKEKRKMTTATKEKVQVNGSKEQTPLHSIQTGTVEATTHGSDEKSLPSLRTENPLVFVRRFAGELERFFEDFGGFRVRPLLRGDLMPRMREFGRAVWAPEVEFFERGGKLIVRADLPGLKENDVRVRVTANSLTLSGERRDEDEEKGEGYYRSERSYGSFYRRIPLPEGVNTDSAAATYTNGVLEIAMLAPERITKGRQLEINEATEQTSDKESSSQVTGQALEGDDR
jgi:HSP20 family protein